MSESDDGIKGQMAEAERIAFENSAPLSLQQLRDLFSYLDVRNQCGHTFSDTRSFAEQHRIDITRLVPWLQEHGAHCDCEVVYNVYDEFGELVGWHLSDA
jgi:hypothetical protein